MHNKEYAKEIAKSYRRAGYEYQQVAATFLVAEMLGILIDTIQTIHTTAASHNDDDDDDSSNSSNSSKCWCGES